MVKKLFSFSLIFIFVFLVGCGATETTTSSTNTESDSGNAVKKVTIQIDGAAVPYYAPLYLAKEKGYFKEEGLEVEFIYAAAADIVKNVAAGNVEFGFPNGDSVISARAENIPVNVVHSTYQNGLGATIFKVDSGIKKPSDLKGRTIAVTSYGSPNYIQLQVLLEQNGLSLDDVNVKIVGTGSIVNSLVVDEVDAITFSLLRTIEMKNQGINVDEFRSDEFLPSHGNVLITSEDYLKNNEDTVKAFIKALNQGLTDMIEGDVEETVKMAINEYSPTFKDKEEIVIESINNVFIPYLWQSELTKSEGLGTSDIEKWQGAIDSLKKYEVIDKELKAEDFVINLK
ncbi:ABC transporter substrate-binding protein [Metabacillus schmidteae]|uniref:ABC transporter substrate-binding protein n=1 Tax=Metabacillus schmidteae TaxID=2730405 RepID=UPI00158EDB5C|nr:ABC transporter substrate-binding protein [Metabacillus schmidteae]